MERCHVSSICTKVHGQIQEKYAPISLMLVFLRDGNISPCTWNEFYHAPTGLVITEDHGCGAPCGAYQPLSVGRATHFTGLRENP